MKEDHDDLKDISHRGIEWVKVYHDNLYHIEQDSLGRFRFQTNNIAGDERWYEGLPEGFEYEHNIVVQKSNFVKDTPVFIDSNPKTAFGAVKPGTFQTPLMPLYEYSLAHYQGALKYGHYNWREDPVSISTYINAARRHIDLYIEGQKEASDTGIHNLAHAMTCLSIVIDAEWYGTLLDDRADIKVRAAEKMEEYFESKKELQLKIAKDWTGHAQKLKEKLKVNKG